MIWPWMEDSDILATIITIGIFMGSIVVPITCIAYLVVFIVRKKVRDVVPLWLIIANVIFLILLGVFIFYWNDPHYNQ